MAIRSCPDAGKTKKAVPRERNRLLKREAAYAQNMSFAPRLTVE